MCRCAQILIVGDTSLEKETSDAENTGKTCGPTRKTLKATWPSCMMANGFKLARGGVCERNVVEIAISDRRMAV